MSKQNKERFNISSITGIAVVLLLVGGTVTTTILFNFGYAQLATLGKPIFVEKGGNIIKREIGPNIHSTLLLLIVQ